MSEDVGFFELAEGIWVEADADRDATKVRLGSDAVGDFVADVHQYGGAWTGDVWEWTAIGAENHPAFATIPERHPWDPRPHWGWADEVHSWGGWTKPHKKRSDHGVGVELGRDGEAITFISMPKSYL